MNDCIIFVDEYLDGIRWDAKYATWDNFIGRPVDGYQVNRIAGTRALCDGLHIAKRQAQAQGLGLLLWDGYRPQCAVDCFLRWASRPEDGATKGRYYPGIARGEMISMGYVAEKSSHSRGSAIDLTLYRLDTNALLPMGGGFDLMDAVSHHSSRQIGRAEATHRKLLRRIMEDSGFLPYEYEWWHYVLKDEPYPETYFNVPIGKNAS